MSDQVNESHRALDDESLLDDIDAELETLARDYETWASEDLGKARCALEKARETRGPRQPHIHEIFGIVHDMKGQGATFGYDLITLIGQSLCDSIRDIPEASDDELRMVDQHLSAMALVLEKKIKGKGGPYADKIQSRLARLVESTRERSKSG